MKLSNEAADGLNRIILLVISLSSLISKDNFLRFNNNGQYGILLLKNIIKPKETESDFYINIVNNINNNFNVSLMNNLESEIIKNIDYEIFFQNIDNL